MQAALPVLFLSPLSLLHSLSLFLYPSLPLSPLSLFLLCSLSLFLSVLIWRCEHAMFCVEILMYNVSRTHSCLYVYK